MLKIERWFWDEGLGEEISVVLTGMSKLGKGFPHLSLEEWPEETEQRDDNYTDLRVLDCHP